MKDAKLPGAAGKLFALRQSSQKCVGIFDLLPH